MQTLEDYLREAMQENHIDFHVRSTITGDGRVTFYIHPSDGDGETADFEVEGNELEHNRDISYRQHES